MKNKDQEIKRLIRTYEDLYIACALNVPLGLMQVQDPTDHDRVISTSLANKIEGLRLEAVEIRDKIYPKEKDIFRLPHLKDMKIKRKGGSE